MDIHRELRVVEMTLGIVMLTYTPSIDNPRHEYAMRTMGSLKKNIIYNGDIRWHVADDGSPPEHFQGLNAPEGTTLTNSNRKGYGANYNLATQALHEICDYMLMVEDDWELTKPLELDPLVEALKNSEIDCIRLGYLGWTQELRGRIMSAANQTFLYLSPDSPEPHVWSGHPRLETVGFQRRVGPWPEGLDPGSTEFQVAKRFESRVGIVWPLDLGIRAGQIQGTLFAHIGQYQAREDQHE